MNPSNFEKEIQNKLNGPTQASQYRGESVSGRLEKFSHDAGEKVGKLATTVSEGASEYVESSRGYIRSKPIQATAMAAAAGLAAGFILTMIARRK